MAPHQKMVLYFGLIRPYKGVERLIEAAQYLPGDETRVVIAGDCAEPLRSKLNQQIATSTACGSIIFLQGYVGNDDLAAYLEAADVVVFPYEHIYQSGAVLLAMTFGKPVVVTDLAGFREYVHDGETGLVTDTNDGKTFALAVMTILQDAALAQKLGRAAAHACTNEFSWGRIAETIVTRAYGALNATA